MSVLNIVKANQVDFDIFLDLAIRNNLLKPVISILFMVQFQNRC